MDSVSFSHFYLAGNRDVAAIFLGVGLIAVFGNRVKIEIFFSVSLLRKVSGFQNIYV